MAGLSLNMGAFGSAGGGYAPAATPAAATASPQGPTTIGQKAYGVVTGGSGGSQTGPVALLSTGALSLIALIYIWYSLPR